MDQSFPPTLTSSITELSFWGKGPVGLFDAVFLYYSDSSTDVVLVNTLVSGNSDWTFVNLTSELDAGKSLTRFTINGLRGFPSFLDDFNLQTDQQVSPVPEASSYLACALLLAPFGAKTLRLLRKRQAA